MQINLLIYQKCDIICDFHGLQTKQPSCVVGPVKCLIVFNTFGAAGSAAAVPSELTNP